MTIAAMSALRPGMAAQSRSARGARPAARQASPGCAGILARAPRNARPARRKRRGSWAMDGIEDVVILCGGRGTRLQEHVPSIPKPLVEIGGEPIVWHVINIYVAQGLRRFVLCTGYRGSLIERFAAARDWPPGVELRCL